MSIAVALTSESSDHYVYAFDSGTTISGIVDYLSQSLDSELAYISEVMVEVSESESLDNRDISRAIYDKIGSLEEE